MSDRLYSLLRSTYVLGAMAAPVVVYRLIGLRARGDAIPRWRRMAQLPGALMSAFTLSPLLLAMSLCAAPRSGESDRAHATKERGDIVANALERYHRAHGTYPDELPGLFAIRASATEDSDGGSGPYPLQYTRTATGFSLRFEYTGFGRLYCTRDAARPTWQCGGYL